MNTRNFPILSAGAFTAFAALAFAPAAHAASVVLDGQPFTTSVPPMDDNGRILVPMRDIFEELGATVTWTQYNQTIHAERAPDGPHRGVDLTMQIGNPAATVDGQPVSLDQPPVLYYDNTLVPLRFVSEALGAQVDWDNDNQVAIIDTDDGQGHWYHGAGHYGAWPAGGANYWRQGGTWSGGLPQNWNNGGYHANLNIVIGGGGQRHGEGYGHQPYGNPHPDANHARGNANHGDNGNAQDHHDDDHHDQ